MRSHISGALRRTLLLKVISKPQPTPEDVASILELTATKVIDGLQAQVMAILVINGEKVDFRHVYFSNALWQDRPDREEALQKARAAIIAAAVARTDALAVTVLDSGDPWFYDADAEGEIDHPVATALGMPIRSMLSVPLRGGDKLVGIIQVIDKEEGADEAFFGSQDQAVLEEVAEYSAPLLQRLIDPAFRIGDRDTARFVARLTDNRLIVAEEELSLDEKLVQVVGDAVIRRTSIFPYKRLTPNSVAVLMTNPLDFPSRETFQTATDLHVEEVAVAPASLIDTLLKKYFNSTGPAPDPSASQDGGSDMSELASVIGMEYGGGEGGDEPSDRDLSDEESAPIIQLANRIIEDAYISGASDIHIEPMEKDLIVRYRVDGICSEKLRLPAKVAGSLVARLKVMSDLDIAEKRLPQDGRIVFKKFTKKNIDIDLRVAVGPMNFGEKVVMRILDKSKSALPITALGFSTDNLTIYRACIQQPYGMILHCGPTGSGKSMTLFSALREVASPEINIQTAEDPIEYTVPGINQMQMHKQIGLTFARALRCYLRMDPDIILVGEIRDQETAEIAVEAALTGHLLLSTLHTNDAPSTISRLHDMGIEPFMISASMLVICAQRLMRRVCKVCRVNYVPEGNEAEIMARALDGWAGPVYRAKPGGCPACGGNGYKGRVGIHELMQNNGEITRAINVGAKTAELKRIAMATGMKTLHQDSMLKVREHITTILESVSTVPPDMVMAPPEEDTAEAELAHAH